MAFVDTYSFTAYAGKGGDGVVRWRREKFVPKGGPNGGNGGKGGDVYIRAVRDIARLSRIVHIKSYRAQAGAAGADRSCTGKGGEDLVIEFPIGSVLTSADTGAVVELLHDGEEILLLKGGVGGFGNEHFKSSTNQQPMQCTKGMEGEHATFKVELKLIADIGLVGLPNAGKTSLLNALTEAGAKVGDYPFTTLEPSLGAHHGFIIADIPGLIEGASQGKGLGHKFLRHISRTKALLYCITSEQDMAETLYKTIRNEIISYGAGLENKVEYVIFTKSDMCSQEDMDKRVRDFEHATGVKVFATVSILDDKSVKLFSEKLTQQLSK